MKIGIVGYGIVGKATERRLAGNEFFILDPPLGFNDDISGCDIIFICINEKNSEMKTLDTIVKSLVLNNKKCFFVIRTTVVPGTTDRYIAEYRRMFVFMPEFLREWNAEYDSLYPDKTIVGTMDSGITEILSILFNGILQVKPIDAELAKLALNSLALIKVVFAEELYDLATKLNADYGNIYKIFKLDQNVNERHLLVYKDGYRGANGKCLPKDSDFLAETGKYNNTPLNLLETAIAINKFMLRYKDGL